MGNKLSYTDYKNMLSTPKKVVVVSHYNPDGDALGASLSLYNFHTERGDAILAIMPNDYPNFLKWMPGNSEVLIAEQNSALAKKSIAEAEILYVVDMNTSSRSGEMLGHYICKSKAVKVLIDHHVNPAFDCDINLSVPKASSTCQLVFDFLFKKLKYPLKELSLEMAQCLYVGIITDTGSLTYACNDAFIYNIIEILIKKGVDGERIHRLVYDNYGESRLKLLGIALGNNLKILKDYKTAYMSLSKSDMIDNNYQIGDTEGFVNYGLSIGYVKLSAIFIEQDKKIRISFRSKGNVNVNILAGKYFNGGGHINAAAAYNYDTLAGTIIYFEKVIKEHYNEFFHEEEL